MNILQQQLGAVRGFMRERHVEMHQKAALPAGRDGVHVAQDGVRRRLKVVLDDLAADFAIQRIPYLPVTGEFSLHISGQVGLGAA